MSKAIVVCLIIYARCKRALNIWSSSLFFFFGDCMVMGSIDTSVQILYEIMWSAIINLSIMQIAIAEIQIYRHCCLFFLFSLSFKASIIACEMILSWSIWGREMKSRETIKIRLMDRLGELYLASSQNTCYTIVDIRYHLRPATSLRLWKDL